MKYSSFLLIPILLCIAFSGCGAGNADVITAKGRITNRGEAIQVDGLEIGIGRVGIELYPLKPDGKPSDDPFTASCDVDGNFDVAGLDGGGIPAGEYLVAIRVWDPEPQVDRLKGRYAFNKTDLKRTIDGKSDLLIDLDVDLAQ